MALELGMTVGELAYRMTEREFLNWMRYSNRKGLPSQRMQLQLGLISLVIARVMGGNEEAVLDDFLFTEKQQIKEMKSDEAAMALGAIAGGVGIVKLGQGRKKGKR
ncbi:MAG: hypothetical protein ABI612_19180 [Betaproteobacteria bacterium]